MIYFVFGAGILTGGLIVFLTVKLQKLTLDIKKENGFNEERDFYKILIEQTDLSIYKNTIDIIESERARIGADIHDDVSQSLSALFLDLDKAIEESSSVYPALNNSLLVISNKLETLIDTMREIIGNVLPPDLIDANLVQSVEELCRRYNNIKGTRIRFESIGEPKNLPEEHFLNVYRIIQELLNNCRKHSRASVCFVQLMWNEEELKLTVFDTGVGLKDSIRNSNQYGIRGIIARCRAMKVLPQFKVPPDKGFEFVLILPLVQSSM